jgi:hypothetical protein
LDASAEKNGWRLNYKLHESASRLAASDYPDFALRWIARRTNSHSS